MGVDGSQSDSALSIKGIWLGGCHRQKDQSEVTEEKSKGWKAIKEMEDWPLLVSEYSSISLLNAFGEYVVTVFLITVFLFLEMFTDLVGEI